jgi:hypothetical protein
MTTNDISVSAKGDPTASSEHHDDVDREALGKDDDTSGPIVSGYEKLSAWETVKTFKMATFVCFMMCFSAAADGYQIGFVGP